MDGHWKDRIPKHLPPVYLLEEEIEGYMIRMFGMVSQKLKEDRENSNSVGSGDDRVSIFIGDRHNHLAPQTGKEGERSMGVAAEPMVVKVGSCLQAKTDCTADVVISDPFVVQIDDDGTVWVTDDCDDLYRRPMNHFVENYVELDFLPDDVDAEYYSKRIADYIEQHGEETL